MREFFVVVETVVFGTHAEVLVPFEPLFLPELEPFHLRSGLAEEFHFHLLELPHAEDELPGHHFVAEGLAYLCDTEGYLHAPGLLDIDIIDENALCGFGAEVDGVGTLAKAAELGAEHEVELPHVRPVLGAGYRVHDAAVEDDLLVFGEVVCFFGLLITPVDLVVLGFFPQDVGIGLAELGLVESLAEALAALLHLLVHLFLYLAQIVFDEIVGAIAFLGVLVVDERVVERRDMAACNPCLGMHEDGGVYAHDILVQTRHGVPPVFLYVVLEFDAHLAVVVNRRQAVVDFAARENEAVLFAMRNQYLEKFVLCHNSQRY